MSKFLKPLFEPKLFSQCLDTTNVPVIKYDSVALAELEKQAKDFTYFPNVFLLQ
jgi:hypothetical protein